MTKQDFLELARYMNKTFDGCYSEEEIKINADTYYSHYKTAKKYGINHGFAFAIRFIIMELTQDCKDNEESRIWLEKITNGLNK